MIVNAAVSGLLLLQHHRVGAAVAAVGQVCGEGAQSGCETVAQSRYAEVRGIPIAAHRPGLLGLAGRAPAPGLDGGSGGAYRGRPHRLRRPPARPGRRPRPPRRAALRDPRVLPALPPDVCAQRARGRAGAPDPPPPARRPRGPRSPRRPRRPGRLGGGHGRDPGRGPGREPRLALPRAAPGSTAILGLPAPAATGAPAPRRVAGRRRAATPSAIKRKRARPRSRPAACRTSWTTGPSSTST